MAAAKPRASPPTTQRRRPAVQAREGRVEARRRSAMMAAARATASGRWGGQGANHGPFQRSQDQAAQQAAAKAMRIPTGPARLMGEDSPRGLWFGYPASDASL